METAPAFYDALAAVYDGMTDFDARLERERAALSPLLQRFDAHTVVDMACGSGVLAIAAASLGARVTGIDISTAMVERAHVHAARHGLPVRFLRDGFMSAALTDLAPVDLLLCMGNSLPHAASIEEITAILACWRECLRPGGAVLVQMLNYARVLDNAERIVAVRRAGEELTVRFYDFHGPETLDFNILVIRLADGGACAHELHTTRLLPLTAHQFHACAREAGFSAVAFHSDLALRPYTEDSRDLVCVLTA